MSVISKFLLYTTLLALLALFSLWFVGGAKQEFTSQLEIKAAPDKVFACLIDPESRQKWSVGASAIVPQSSPPFALGATFRSTRQRGTETVQVDEEFIQFDPGFLLSIRCHDEELHQTAIFQLQPAGEGQTRLTYLVRQNHRGWSRVWVPINKSDDQDRMNREIAQIKSLVEGQATGSPTGGASDPAAGSSGISK